MGPTFQLGAQAMNSRPNACQEVIHAVKKRIPVLGRVSGGGPGGSCLRQGGAGWLLMSRTLREGVLSHSSF